MNPQILLEKIIEKAVKNGWKPFWNGATWDKSDLAGALFDDRGLNGVLFDHSFAKAFFGEAGRTKEVTDVQHEWVHTYTLEDTGRTKVYSCKVCNSMKHGEIISYYDGDGGETTDPKLASPSYVLNPHGVSWWNKGWMTHLEKLALTPPEERLSYLEHYL